MDCIKNLTSCAGCTKKHARCHWVHVSRDEVGALDHLMEAAYPGVGSPPAVDSAALANGYTNGVGRMSIDEAIMDDDSDDDDSNPLEDLEALGEKEEREHEAAAERLREDEEGLRNAKELARQGWEEGLRHDQEPSTAEEPNAQPDRVEDDMNQTRVGDESSPASVPQLNGDTGSHSDERIHEGHDDNDRMDVKPVSGFRAVNENVQPVMNGAIGWRPS